MIEEVIKLIQTKGQGLEELVFDFDLSLGTFNSIEINNGKVQLNLWTDCLGEASDTEKQLDFKSLPSKDQEKIIDILKSF